MSLVWIGLVFFGLNGSGIAFFGLYVAYWTGIYLVVRRLSGFRWSAANLRLAAAVLRLGIATVFVGWYFLPLCCHRDSRGGAHVAGRDLFVENTLCVGSFGTVPTSRAKNNCAFPVGAIQTPVVEMGLALVPTISN